MDLELLFLEFLFLGSTGDIRSFMNLPLSFTAII